MCAQTRRSRVVPRDTASWRGSFFRLGVRRAGHRRQTRLLLEAAVMRRAFRSPDLARAYSSGLFGGLSESVLLTNLLKTPKTLKEFPFVEYYRRLGALNSTPRARPNVLLASRSSIQTPEPSQAALALMTQAAVSTKSLDNFLETHYLAHVSPSEKLEALDRGLLDLVTAATPNNLRTMMQYLARYWQCGLFGTRPLIRSARQQARYVLERALAVHPATAHANGGEQVGVPDLHKFETFVSNFFDYLGVQHSPDDELEEILLQLSAQSGTLAATVTQILSIPHGRLSEETMQRFLIAFAASSPSRKSVEAIKGVLLNNQTGPAAVKFLLPYTQATAEIFALLEVVDRSALRRHVYEQCQYQLLERLLRLADHNLALMFGLVTRIAEEVHHILSPELLNLVLRTTLSQENHAAMHQALKLGERNGAQLDADLVSEAQKRLAAANATS